MTDKENDRLPRPSRLGKAGMICGIVSLALLAFFVIAAPMATAQFASAEDAEPVRPWQVLAVLAFVGFSAAPLLSVIGMLLAIAGLLRKHRRRGLSLAGLLVSLSGLLMFGLACLLLSFWMDGLLQG